MAPSGALAPLSIPSSSDGWSGPPTDPGRRIFGGPPVLSRQTNSSGLSPGGALAPLLIPSNSYGWSGPPSDPGRGFSSPGGVTPIGFKYPTYSPSPNGRYGPPSPNGGRKSRRRNKKSRRRNRKSRK